VKPDWQIAIGPGTVPLGYVEIFVEGEEQGITVLPPIVEVWTEADKRKHNIINDGMHRCFLARTCHIPPAVVRIECSIPYYAYPLPDGWAGVQLISKLHGDFVKKFHRMPDYKAFYRDFNSVFLNVGGPRGSGEPKPPVDHLHS
jgi:hypothetical protein